MRPLIALLPILTLIAGCDRQSPTPPQENAAEAPAKAETGSLDTSRAGTAAPSDAFEAPGGAPVTLAAFKGKPLLVNLWATWCAPCVAEMPTLDALAERMGDRLQVLVVSQDMQGGAVVAPYFEKAGFTQLKPYLDPENALGFALADGNLPTTILYDAEGKEVWRIVGSLDWNGERAVGLLDTALGTTR